MTKIDPQISGSLEDYLEAISEILEQDDHAHTKEIAEKLGVSMPSVTNALQSLAARGLVVYHSHAPVRLTESGAAKAAGVRRRHTALRKFLTDLLKVPEADADTAACRIEHVVGEPIISRMIALTDFIESRQECAALRRLLDESMPGIFGAADADDGLISLDNLPPKHHAKLVYISENLRGIKKFSDMGLVPGAILEHGGVAPFGDLIRIRLMDTQLSLRGADAGYIWVKVLD